MSAAVVPFVVVDARRRSTDLSPMVNDTSWKQSFTVAPSPEQLLARQLRTYVGAHISARTDCAGALRPIQTTDDCDDWHLAATANNAT